jgi:hypothetical protein
MGPTGPLVTTSGCQEDCGHPALVRASVSGLLKLSGHSIAPPAQVTAGLTSFDSALSVQLADATLRQRPPPSSRLG